MRSERVEPAHDDEVQALGCGLVGHGLGRATLGHGQSASEPGVGELIHVAELGTDRGQRNACAPGHLVQAHVRPAALLAEL
jgi:hypothetical protein